MWGDVCAFGRVARGSHRDILWAYRTPLGTSVKELSGWEPLKKTGQAWVGKPPALEVRLLGAPDISIACYCPRVLEGITLLGAVRSSLDASQGRVKDSAGRDRVSQGTQSESLDSSN